MLTDRKQRVLEAIVDNYVETALPVGSRTLSRKYRLGISPATIRNEMSDLEELGFLEQPHTSAGRVPSDTGYRLYVDNLMKVRQLALNEMHRIDQLFQHKTLEFEHIISVTARVLSELTSCLAVVDRPDPGEISYRKLQLLPLEPGRALLVMVAIGGMVEHRIVELPPDAGPAELAYVSSLLNNYLVGRDLKSVESEIISQLRSELERYRQVVENVMEMLSEQVTSSDERLVWDGTSNILNQPEFQDVGRVRNVLRAVECAQVVRQLLSSATTPGSPVIMIGGETSIDDIKDCSLVIAPYYAGGRLIGRLGILGPRRMEYGRVVAIVSRIAEVVSESLAVHDYEE